MAPFLGLIRRDLRLALRQGGEMGLVLGFFVLARSVMSFRWADVKTAASV